MSMNLLHLAIPWSVLWHAKHLLGFAGGAGSVGAEGDAGLVDSGETGVTAGCCFFFFPGAVVTTAGGVSFTGLGFSDFPSSC